MNIWIYKSIYIYMNVWIYKWIYVWMYIYIKKERKRHAEKQRGSTNKTNTTEVWFNFHRKYRCENIAKSLPLSGKN